MTLHRATHTLWFIARPSDDVVGDWEAHCLEFDLVSQGTTIEEALALAQEAARIHIRALLSENRDPYSTRAPEEFWRFRDAIVRVGEQLSMEQLLRDASGATAWVVAADLPVEVDLGLDETEPEPQPRRSPVESGLIWKKAA